MFVPPNVQSTASELTTLPVGSSASFGLERTISCDLQTDALSPESVNANVKLRETINQPCLQAVRVDNSGVSSSGSQRKTPKEIASSSVDEKEKQQWLLEAAIRESARGPGRLWK